MHVVVVQNEAQMHVDATRLPTPAHQPCSPLGAPSTIKHAPEGMHGAIGGEYHAGLVSSVLPLTHMH